MVTAFAAYPASGKERVLPWQDVCQVQDSCGFPGARLVNSGIGSLLREPSPTRTRSFGLSRHLCSVSCMISVLCLAELLQCFSSHESCVTGCLSFQRIFGSTFLHTNGSRQASNHDRTASVGLFSQDTHRRAAARPLCNCEDTPSRLSGHRARVNLVARPTQHAHAFFARISDHGSPNPQFFKHINHKDRRQLQLSKGRWLHDCTAGYVRSRSRDTFPAFLGTPRADGARQVRLACAKPQTTREV